MLDKVHSYSNYAFCFTHFDRLPSIRYRRPLSISAHDFPHFLNSWIGRHQVVKRQLILVVNPADIATSSDLPEDQTECVHISPLERVEVVHVYRLFKNLKAENVRTGCRRTAFLTEYKLSRIIDVFIDLIIIIFPYIFIETYSVL